ncbi:major facilitator superfamily transporter [Grosmannia clavigera kw1407]|uniref:Major facilitator superfamily transporter n=1 Tax=Grosmannia clavigera (strain kw1407 / UAMH 11150) TaxID=655863 RepID=F0X8A6_GROCL|nr:major facilitator superfamily transporter [Grosmannia clavigera kw1407]EFX06098.1 major facilitator superfamily transporter [Grosmannia clavigera kw1407]
MMHQLISIESSSAPALETTSTSTDTRQFDVPTRPAKAISRIYAAVPLKESSAREYEQRSNREAFDASDLERSRPVTPTGLGDIEDDDPGSPGSPGRNGNGLSGDEADGVEALQSIWDPYMNRFRLATISLINFANGLNDSAAGAVLPYIERHFGIGYAIVSLIFVGLALGSIMAAPVVDLIRRRLGRGRTLVFSQLLMAAGCIPILTTKAPFPAIVIGYFAVGFGEALNLAMGNTFCANLRQTTVALGLMHGSYGIGGISGPLIATALAVASGAAANPDNKTAAAYSYYYFVPCGIMLFTAVAAGWSFAGYEKDDNNQVGAALELSNAGVLTESPSLSQQRQQRTLGRNWRGHSRAASQAASRAPSPESLSLVPTSSRPAPTPLQASTVNPTPAMSYSSTTRFMTEPVGRACTPIPAAAAISAAANSANGSTRARQRPQRPHMSPFLAVFSARMSRVVLLGALFIMCYQGAEVSIAGWVTSFLIADRGGHEPNVGYVTSGFWGGITLGRFLLAGPAHLIGERRAVYLCVVGSAIFELLVWFVPNVIGDAVAVAIVGLLLGPVYPCAAAVLMRSMNHRERVTGIGITAAFGSAGGAAAPFITGVLAQAVGTFVLHPIALALFAFMIVFWYNVPVLRKPTELKL